MPMSVSPECLNELYLRMNVCGANAAGFMVLNAAFSGTFGHGQRHSALGRAASCTIRFPANVPGDD